MGWTDVGLPPVLPLVDADSPFWDPYSSPRTYLVNTLALRAASAADPVSWTARNRRRINSLGIGSMG
jgi:hypothetical protein